MTLTDRFTATVMVYWLLAALAVPVLAILKEVLP